MRYSYWVCLLWLLLLSSIASQPHLDTAKSYVGTTELTGKNDGTKVEKFLKSVGRHRGDSWCAAFVSYCLTVGKVNQPRTRSGLARSFKNNKGIIKAVDVLRGTVTIPKGSIIGWEKGTTISGHIGFTTAVWKGQSGRTVEGNTSSGVKGSQADGDGVYLRNRTIQPASYFRICWFVPVSYK